MLMDMWCSDRY